MGATLSTDPRLVALLAALSGQGLNAAGLCDAAAWDAVAPAEQRSHALFPGAAQLLVVGSGGGDLWRAFLAWLDADPSRLLAGPHPLDAFVAATVHAADPALGALSRRWVFASPTSSIFLDFRLLAATAGLGQRGRLGLLMHPEHGPWLGLRAACFVGEALGPASPAVVTLACTGCPAPCLAACPGQAFVDGQWSVGRCATFHAESDRCARTCHSREACPAGASARYPADALAYHSDRLGGRAALRRRLGIPDGEDPHAGPPVAWSRWVSGQDRPAR